MTLNRRELIQRGAVIGGLVITGSITDLLGGKAAARAPKRSIGRMAKPAPAGAARSWHAGYGPLVPDPNKLLDLPEGFSYTIVSEAGKPLTPPAAGRIPDRFDGMGYFERDGRRFLVRNSEQDTEAKVPAVATGDLTFDNKAQGGTTTVELDASGKVVAEYVSLAGTVSNCAGGTTPWGTWLTCEETEDKAGDDFLQDHGWVFEVDPFDAEKNAKPVPLEGLGRFPHEAVCIDPKTGVVYLTEDASNPNGLLYRATPAKPLGGYGSLRDGAKLEALVAMDDKGGFIADLSEVATPGTKLKATWTELPDPLAKKASTRKQLNKVTRSRKLEGAWWGNDGAYFACSYARHKDGSVNEHDGQIWKLDPAGETIELVIQFEVNADPKGDNFDGPDNITVSPWGGLLLCSDGEGAQHLYTVSAAGEASIFARNARDAAAEEVSEFAGAVFSTDGKTLYVNFQEPGINFAITGPWEGGATTTTTSSTPASSTTTPETTTPATTPKTTTGGGAPTTTTTSTSTTSTTTPASTTTSTSA